MAQKPQKKNTQKKGDQSSKTKAPQRRRDPDSISLNDSQTILDSNTRRDIAGIVFIIAAAITFLIAVLPQDNALVSDFASMCVHNVFGIGCYILPFALLAIGITFLGQFQHEHISARTTIGLSIIFVALLAIISLCAPIQVLGHDDPNLLFTPNTVRGYGGYIGSALAFCGIILFGRAVSFVIFGGVMIVGLIIIGFSLSKTITSFRTKHANKLHGLPSRIGSNTSTQGFARIRRDGQRANQGAYLNNLQSNMGQVPYDPSQTAVIGQDGSLIAYADLERDAKEPSQNMLGTGQASDGYPNMALQSGGSSQVGNPRINGGVDTSTMRLDASEAAMLVSGNDQPYSNNPRTRRNADPLSMTRTLGASRKTPPAEDTVAETPHDEQAENVDNIERIEHIDQVGSSTDEGRPQRKKRKASAKAVKAASSDEVDEPITKDGFILPGFSLLNQASKPKSGKGESQDLQSVAGKLQDTLANFGIDVRVVDWIKGPTVTLYEVDLPAGVRVSRIIALNDDIALALASPGVRIFAPVPGTNYVGIEVPNAKRETVLLSDVLKNAPSGPMQIAIGKDVEGNSIVSDLSKMPHLLIGGTTGSGKSVSINAMIMSILMRATPSEVRMIMIDPKRVEFTPYCDIPHLYVPVVTEPRDAANALGWGVAEMERRLKVFSKVGARNITQYNDKVKEHISSLESDEGDDQEDKKDGSDDLGEMMPYIVIIIDELADLMMNVGKEVETYISRIAQLARAAGIHLIVATQRPSANVVTGLIKSNITNRIAFNVASGIDSRVIIDTIGAESLIGLGDMLLSKPELSKPQRIQACFVSEDEINRVVGFIKEQGTPDYHNEILQTNTYSIGDTDPHGGSGGDRDPLIWEAADIVVSSSLGSTSNIQRRLKVGYARAGRIMDQLEEIGIVGSANGSRPREVLVDQTELETIKAFETSDN